MDSLDYIIVFIIAFGIAYFLIFILGIQLFQNHYPIIIELKNGEVKNCTSYQLPDSGVITCNDITYPPNEWKRYYRGS